MGCFPLSRGFVIKWSLVLLRISATIFLLLLLPSNPTHRHLFTAVAAEGTTSARRKNIVTTSSTAASTATMMTTTTMVSSVSTYVMNGMERIGRVRYHYYNDNDYNENDGNGDLVASPPGTVPFPPSLNNYHRNQCPDVLVIGVGTAMSASDYDKLAQHSVSTSLMVIILDHNPGRVVKTSATKYVNAMVGIRNQLHVIIPHCGFNNTKESGSINSSNDGRVDRRQKMAEQQPATMAATAATASKFLIGGHSASGQAALEAAQKGMFNETSFVPSGFVGLDPYEISKRTMDMNSPLHQFPTLNWGFTDTTCLVQVQKAASGAYHLSSPSSSSSGNGGRILYSIDNSQNTMMHCVFTDSGCGVAAFTVCPTEERYDWVFESVAQSVHKFLSALKSETPFQKEHFELPETISGSVFLYADNDEPAPNVTKKPHNTAINLLDDAVSSGGSNDSKITELVAGSSGSYSRCIFHAMLVAAVSAVYWVAFSH